jgi:hypothetical protein
MMNKDFIDKFAHSYPEIWRRLNTKAIDNPGSHSGFKSVAAIVAQGISAMINGNSDFQVFATCAAPLEKHDYPTYYVSRPLTDALKHTAPPPNMTWADVAFPYDAIIFMLPNDAIVNLNDGGRIPFLVVVRKPIGEQRILGTNLRIGNDEERISICWPEYKVTGEFMGNVTFSPTETLKVPLEWMRSAPLLSGQAGEGDDETASYLTALASNLLLLMTARPEMVEPGGKTKQKRQSSGLFIQRPTWLGRKYETVYEQSDGPATGHFTELGWRSGFLRRQHFGAGNKQEKIIWIEPYMARCKKLVRAS